MLWPCDRARTPLGVSQGALLPVRSPIPIVPANWVCASQLPPPRSWALPLAGTDHKQKTDQSRYTHVARPRATAASSEQQTSRQGVGIRTGRVCMTMRVSAVQDDSRSANGPVELPPYQSMELHPTNEGGCVRLARNFYLLTYCQARSSNRPRPSTLGLAGVA